MRIFFLVVAICLSSCHTAREVYQFKPISIYQKAPSPNQVEGDAAKVDSVSIADYKIPTSVNHVEKKLIHKKRTTALPIVVKRHARLAKSIVRFGGKQVSSNHLQRPQDYDAGKLLFSVVGLALCYLSIIPLGYVIAGLLAMDSAAAMTAGIVFLAMFGLGLILVLVNK